jgi:hypothetical protein
MAAKVPGTLIVAHKLGYLEQAFDGPPATRVIRLKPWGRIIGIAGTTGQPSRNQTVALSNLIHPDPSRLNAFLTAPVDAAGCFAFEGVPPGEWKVGPHSLWMQVEPGKTTQVPSVPEARTLIGRLNPGELAPAFIDNGYTLRLSSKWFPLRAPRRDEFTTFSSYACAKNAWMKKRSEFMHSEEGREALRHARDYTPALQDDGSFIIDALPGTYDLKVMASPLRNDPLQMDLWDDLSKEVIVPESGDSESIILDISELNRK